MTNKTGILVVLALFVLSFFCALLDQAEARRLGGGRSFGSRPSYQRSAPSQNQGTQPGQASPASPVAAPRPWGGMLGGLLMGGLIGSLLFGGGFKGFGMLDIVVLGGLAFFFIRYLRARSMAAEGLQASYAPAPSGGSYEDEGRNAWAPGAVVEPIKATGPSIPPDFDQAEFLKGAKVIYARLQDSWNRRDLEDIRQFTSPEVWAEIKRQAEEDPHPSNTEVLLVNASLLDVKKVDGQTVGSVVYDVLMRENPEQAEPSQVQEVWHFSRDENKPGSFWLLEGIQQVES